MLRARAAVRPKRLGFFASHWENITPFLTTATRTKLEAQMKETLGFVPSSPTSSSDSPPATPPRRAASSRQAKKQETLTPIKQPSKVTGKMRDYQVKGISWLSHRRENGVGCILADEMGLVSERQLLSNPHLKLAFEVVAVDFVGICASIFVRVKPFSSSSSLPPLMPFVLFA